MDTVQQRYLEMCVESLMILLSAVQAMCTSMSCWYSGCNLSQASMYETEAELQRIKDTLSMFQQTLCQRLADTQDFIQMQLDFADRSNESKVNEILDKLHHVEKMLEAAIVLRDN